MPIVTKTRLSVALKTRWRNKGPRTLDDVASVVGFNVWKIALETFKHMEREGFRFASDAQVTQVMTEFIAFLVQSTDRLVYGRLGEADRALFINGLGKHLAKTMENNQMDLFGPGDYQAPFIDAMNRRSHDYAEYGYTADGPTYGYLRYLAERVSEAMAMTDAKWVVEHVMEIEAPDMLKFLKKLLTDALVTKTD